MKRCIRFHETAVCDLSGVNTIQDSTPHHHNCNTENFEGCAQQNLPRTHTATASVHVLDQATVKISLRSNEHTHTANCPSLKPLLQITGGRIDTDTQQRMHAFLAATFHTHLHTSFGVFDMPTLPLFALIGPHCYPKT